MWAKDEATGAVALKRIAQTFERVAPSTLALTFSNGETIETTAEHPFYVQDKGFTPAGLVAIGNSIVTRAGPSLQVTRVEKHNSARKVYNFEVEDFHSYFVGQSALWVHNVNCDDLRNAATARADGLKNDRTLNKFTRPSTVVAMVANGSSQVETGANLKGGTTRSVYPKVQKALDDLRAQGNIQTGQFGQCGEMEAISAILYANPNVTKVKAFAVQVGGPNSPRHGKAIAVCADCQNIFGKMGIEIVDLGKAFVE